MKAKLLFIDDEPLIIQGLRRMLRSMRNTWEMLFVDAPDQAWQALQTVKPDILVTDLCMPGTNGITFLKQAAQHFPDTCRIVLSGQTDMEQILPVTRYCHQYLAKPCDPDHLKVILQRMLQIKGRLSHRMLRERLLSLLTLPVLPRSSHELKIILNNNEAPFERLRQLLAKDMGMTANLLKLICSDFFGRRHPTDLNDAFDMLGKELIKTLTENQNFFDPLVLTPSPVFDIEAQYLHSREVALAARKIAINENASSKTVFHAYVAGLLHNVGRVLCALFLTEEYTSVLTLMHTQKMPLHLAEKKILQMSHGEIGAFLLGIWGLPEPVTQAVEFQNNPSDSNLKGFHPLTAVHLALALVGEPKGQVGGMRDDSYLARISLAHAYEKFYSRLPE